MARTVKTQEHAAKREAIVATARRLVFSKGFEQMTIQDVLDALQISKGGFYHYFDSKTALLEALVQQLLNEAVSLLRPIADAPELGALDKLRRYFVAVFDWRTERKDVLLTILSAWYRDDNALLRQKTRAAMLQSFTPLVTTIIQQGVQEGAFATRYPEWLANVVVLLRMGLSETLADLLLVHDTQGTQDEAQQETRQDAHARIENTIAAHTEAIERVLGIQSGCLQLADADVVKTWWG